MYILIVYLFYIIIDAINPALPAIPLNTLPNLNT